jgi:hypothetical protein
MNQFPKLDDGVEPEPEKSAHQKIMEGVGFGYAMGGPVTGHMKSGGPSFNQFPKLSNNAVIQGKASGLGGPAGGEAMLPKTHPLFFPIMYGIGTGKTNLLAQMMSMDQAMAKSALILDNFGASLAKVHEYMLGGLKPYPYISPAPNKSGLEPPKPWEARLPQDRKQIAQNGFRSELIPPNRKRRLAAKAARRARRRHRN